MKRWYVLFLLAVHAVALMAESRASTVEFTSLTAGPALVQLEGPQACFQLLVDGQTADGFRADVTANVDYASDSLSIATVSESGLVRAVNNGRTRIRVSRGAMSAFVDVVVRGSQRTHDFDFENDVVPYLTRFGCNSSACHGKAEGQNGLKFSVFGYDPESDFQALVRASRGRRVSVVAPARSLFLRKATQALPHVGGQAIAPDSDAYAWLLAWVAAGASFGRDDAAQLTHIEVTPSERQLRTKATQQLRVTAVFSDGRRQDVTRLARYRSNNEGLATVGPNGVVTIGAVPGQVAIMASFLGAVDTFVSYIPRDEAVSPYPQLPEDSFIDRLVHQNLEKLNLLPSAPVNDGDFLRRVYIDIIGTLPTAAEAREFLTDTHPKRRQRLVNDLLDRPEYATYWALKWSDLLRVDRAVLGHRRAYAYYGWIRDRLRANLPMDEFARAIITATGPLDESPQGSFYQAIVEPGDRASAFTQVFLGIRIDCAECHHHPFDRWSQQDYYGMTAYFAQVAAPSAPPGDAIVTDTSIKIIHPRTGAEVQAHPLGAIASPDAARGDRRQALADWLTAPDNPWFARNLANRTWAHFFGSGLVQPVDDVRQTNPSSNSELLDQLAEFLREHNYHIKPLIQLITASHAYQRTAQPNATNQDDTQNASRALLKPIEAEVLLDAISQTTGIPARFDGAAAGMRAIELWDSKLQHPFLRLFGRPERKTACECERASEPSVGQVLHMMNSPEIFAKLTHQGGRVAKLVREISDDDELAEELYLTFLSRFPTPSERQVISNYFTEHGSSRSDAAVDLAWSLINSLEFSFNH